VDNEVYKGFSEAESPSQRGAKTDPVTLDDKVLKSTTDVKLNQALTSCDGSKFVHSSVTP